MAGRWRRLYPYLPARVTRQSNDLKSAMTNPGNPPDSRSAASLRPTLGWAGLLVLGVAYILGAGVFVMTGTAAASFAGPAVTISFMLAGFACLLVGLCYAQLASRLLESGSSYTYCRRTFGPLPG